MDLPKELKVYFNPEKVEESEVKPTVVQLDTKMVPTIEDVITAACKTFGIEESEHVNYMFKMRNKRLIFSDASTLLMMQEATLFHINDEMKDICLRLEDITEELMQNAHVSQIKDLMQKKEISIENKNFLGEITKNFELGNDIYIEEFIALGGIQQLMTLAVNLDGGLSGYCLKIFFHTIEYLSAVEYIKKKPEIISNIYILLDKDDIIIKKNTLNILSQLLRNVRGAFMMINKAALNHGFRSERSPYSPLIEALQLKDEELKEKVIHFFNWMIYKCPKEEDCCKFQSRLENLGVLEECQKVCKTKNMNLRKVLVQFQQNYNIVIKSSMYELEIHRNRISELEEHCKAYETRLAGLQEQQNFYTIMKKDYQKFFKLAKESMEKPTLFNPFAHTGNYQKEDLMKLPYLKRNIVGKFQILIIRSQRGNPRKQGIHR